MNLKFVSLQALVCASTLVHAQEIDPKLTEVYSPVPPVVATDRGVPSDAVILFDGSNLDRWKSVKTNGEAQWKVCEKVLTVEKGTGDIVTIDTFSNFQLHLEWRSPEVVKGEGQGRGNSGIFLMERYEIQILDCFENTTYSNGQTGAVYKQIIPMANACKKPGEWQTYDIIFKAPVFDKKGKTISPAYVTVIHNGVLLHNHVALKGETVYRGAPEYKVHGPAGIKLQDHGDAVSFKNIWIRRLP